MFIFSSPCDLDLIFLFHSDRISCEKAAAIHPRLAKRASKKLEEHIFKDDEEEEEEEEEGEHEMEDKGEDDMTDPGAATVRGSSAHAATALSADAEENLYDDTHESRREFMYRTFRDAMCERFLRGEDAEYINYDDIDNDDTPDMILSRARDEEESYFDGADDGLDAADKVVAAGTASAPMVVAAEDDYMNFDLSQL